MCTLRYAAWISPSGPTCSDVLRSSSSPSARSEIEPATSSMPSSRAVAARPRRPRAAVERLRAGAQVLAAAEHAPLLGQHDELRAVGRGRAREAVRALEVAVEVGGAGQLDGGDAHGFRLQD